MLCSILFRKILSLTTLKQYFNLLQVLMVLALSVCILDRLALNCKRNSVLSHEHVTRPAVHEVKNIRLNSRLLWTYCRAYCIECYTVWIPQIGSSGAILHPPQGSCLKGPTFSALLHTCTWFIVDSLWGIGLHRCGVLSATSQMKTDPQFVASYKGRSATMPWDLLSRTKLNVLHNY